MEREKGKEMEERKEMARRLSSIIESLLLVSTRPLRMEVLRKLLSTFEETDFQSALLVLEEKYGEDSGILLARVAGGIQLRTSPSNQDYVRAYLDAKPARLSRAAMETLAIIAYRQPVTRAEVEDIRGVDSQGSIKTLIDRHLVRVMGKKEVPGRPFLFSTTREFLELFGLEDLASLPTLSEMEEIMGEFPAESPEGGGETSLFAREEGRREEDEN